MTEFDGVIQQIIEYLLDFIHVRHHIHLVAREHKLNADHFLTAGALEGGGDIADHGVNLKVCFIQHHALCIQVVEGQEAVCQLRQTACLIQHNI